jgi:long-chain fatty acid transport protein
MKFRLVFIGVFSLFSLSAFASGFQMWQQSGASVGDYAAGAAAIADDASTAYYNPAGLTRIKHQDVAISLITPIRNVQFDGTETVNVTGFSDNSGKVQGGGLRYMPTILYAAPISDKWAFGFAVTSPFDSRVNYGSNSFTRYDVVENKVNTYDVNASLAYKIIDSLSVGVGVSFQRLEVYNERIDTPTNNVSGDVVSKNKAKDWRWGYNGGLLWEPSDKTRFGLAYRSRIIHNANGESSYNGNSSDAEVHLVIPPTTIFSGYHEFNDHWSLMGSVSYTQWDQVHKFEMTNVAGFTTPIVIQQQLKNAWNFALGTHYKLNDKFVLRSGIGYAQSPVKDEYSNLNLPDGDQYIIAVGLGYWFTKTMSFDVGYSHIFYKSESVNLTDTFDSRTVTSDGKLNMSDDIIGLQFNWLMT